MAQVSDGRQRPLVGVTQGPDAIGVPSTGLSLGWLLASRASLRFTRHAGDTDSGPQEQEQVDVAGQEDLQGSSEGTLFFCPKHGVHLTEDQVATGSPESESKGIRRQAGCWTRHDLENDSDYDPE
jgi:hypothetical protein